MYHTGMPLAEIEKIMDISKEELQKRIKEVEGI